MFLKQWNRHFNSIGEKSHGEKSAENDELGLKKTRKVKDF